MTWVRRVSLEGRGSWRLPADRIPWGSAGELRAIWATAESTWAMWWPVQVPSVQGTCVLGREECRPRAVISYFTFSMSRPFALFRSEGQLDASLEFSGEVKTRQTAGTAQRRDLNSQVSAEGHLRCECGQAIWSVTKRKSQQRGQRKRGEVVEGRSGASVQSAGAKQRRPTDLHRRGLDCKAVMPE